ncbi:MAG: HAD family hydrolase [Lentisphaerota bacterium]
MKKAVFLDRDGTIMFDPGYISDPGKVEIFGEAAEALKALKKAGYLLVIITNQSGIGRGYFSAEDLEKVNMRMRALFEERGVCFDAIYACPHVDENKCTCRKPQPGLIFKAAREHDIDISVSYMVGNSRSDVMAGVAAGCRLNFLLGSEKGSLARNGILSVSSVEEAAEIILGLDEGIVKKQLGRARDLMDGEE